MPRTKKPRKPRVPKMVNIPVTRGLVDDFGMVMHTSLAIMEHAPSAEAFDAIGRCLNVIGIALKNKPLLEYDFLPAIRSGTLAMAAIGERAERLDVWHASELELVPIRHAVTRAEQLLTRFQVFDLYRAMQVLKFLESRPVARAADVNEENNGR